MASTFRKDPGQEADGVSGHAIPADRTRQLDGGRVPAVVGPVPAGRAHRKQYVRDDSSYREYLAGIMGLFYVDRLANGPLDQTAGPASSPHRGNHVNQPFVTTDKPKSTAPDSRMGSTSEPLSPLVETDDRRPPPGGNEVVAPQRALPVALKMTYPAGRHHKRGPAPMDGVCDPHPVPGPTEPQVL